MKRVGITGGIGAGKSVVCKIFNKLGIAVYNADEAARNLMNHDIVLKKKLINIFGENLYNSGSLNRKWLSEIVFENPMQLAQLNKLVHPAVAADFIEWEAAQSKSPYIIREAAILFESDTYKDLDHIILVDAPVNVRICRVQQRDHRSLIEINKILSNQWSSDKKRALADTIIENDDRHLVIPQILSFHYKFLTACE